MWNLNNLVSLVLHALFLFSCSLIYVYGLTWLGPNIEEDIVANHGEELPNSERGIPEGSREM